MLKIAEISSCTYIYKSLMSVALRTWRICICFFVRYICNFSISTIMGPMQQDEKPYSWLLLSWPQIIRQETVRLNHLSPIPMTLDQQVQVVHVRRRRHHGRGRVRGVGGGRRYRCCCGVRVSPRYLIKRQMHSSTSFYNILIWISILEIKKV